MLTVDCEGYGVEPLNQNKVRVELDEPDIQDIVNGIGEKELLEAIGRDKAINYFNIEEVES